jgi:hypothetical protein
LTLFIFLFLAFVVNGETNLLNLRAYSEGSSPLYGENIVVEQDEKTGVKWITQGKQSNTEGKLKFPVNLTGEFEVVIELSGRFEKLFLTADEYKVKIDFGNRRLYADNESAGSDQSSSWIGSKNAWKLSVSNNIAKLYLNDVFSQKMTLKPDLTYTQLLIQNLSNHSKLYAIMISGSNGSSQPPVSGNSDFESGKQAGIQQCVSDPASCGIKVLDKETVLESVK